MDGLFTIVAVHWLDQEMGEMLSPRVDRVDPRLQPHQFQLVSLRWTTLGPGLGADAQPVDSAAQPAIVPLLSTATPGSRSWSASIQSTIELEHRFTASDHHQAI